MTYKNLKYKIFLWIVIFSLSFWFSLKILRFNDFFFSHWYLYAQIFSVLIILSALININFFFGTIKNLFENKFLKRYQLSYLFIIILMVIFTLQIIINFGNYATFTIASLAFFLYFPLIKILNNQDQKVFFKIFETSLIIIALINIFDTYNLVFGVKIFDYNLILSSPGVEKGILALNAPNPIFDWRGRNPGVSGTVYASSALMCAATIYFFLQQKLIKGFITGLSVLLFATGSTIIILLLIILLNFFKNNLKSLFILFIATIFAYIIVLNRLDGLTLSTWSFWPSLRDEFTFIDLIKYFFIGEGFNQTKISFKEWRGFELIFSFGFVGILSMCGLLYNTYKINKNLRNQFLSKYHKSLFNFLLVIILSSWHYPTFMIFPNIVYFISTLAFLNSMQNRKNCIKQESKQKTIQL